jgi:hypothetical protein
MQDMVNKRFEEQVGGFIIRNILGSFDERELRKDFRFMKMEATIAILTSIILSGCATSDTDLVSLEAQVQRYIPQARDVEYVNGGRAVFDAVEFRISSPVKWQGTNLVVYCTPGHNNALFHRTGAWCSFQIERKYIIGRSVDPKTGKTTVQNPFDGVLKNLKEIK